MVNILRTVWYVRTGRASLSRQKSLIESFRKEVESQQTAALNSYVIRETFYVPIETGQTYSKVDLFQVNGHGHADV